jgi:hypothetical protein
VTIVARRKIRSHPSTSIIITGSECIASTAVEVNKAPKFLFSDLFAVLFSFSFTTDAVFVLVLIPVVLPLDAPTTAKPCE